VDADALFNVAFSVHRESAPPNGGRSVFYLALAIRRGFEWYLDRDGTAVKVEILFNVGFRGRDTNCKAQGIEMEIRSKEAKM